ncbi:MAG: DNA primase [Nanoarchaeota archaeon]|nr:DNA primase [Nanoarchaeota archaeon]
MGKIYPVSTKYIITAAIEAEGSIDKNDIVGAIFGQTEGLLGDELELRELQKSGRIGRIDVKVETKNDKTTGTITVPSSLAKAETAIIAASLETIERIGPCVAEVNVKEIEDVRFNKREMIMDRAKNLLKKLNLESTDSQEIMSTVKKSVRAANLIEYGPDKLAASNDIESAEEVILVEGRADVVNMLKNRFGGLLSVNGVNVPKSVKKILDTKVCTLFVDGDRGGKLIAQKVMNLGNLEYIAVAPDGKEVEELTSKEIHKCLRSRMKASEFFGKKTRGKMMSSSKKVHKEVKGEANKFKELLNDLFGTRGAYLLDENMNIKGKLPASEIVNTLTDSSDNIVSIVVDGVVDKELVSIAEEKGVSNIVSNNIKAKSKQVNLIEL